MAAQNQWGISQEQMGMQIARQLGYPNVTVKAVPTSAMPTTPESEERAARERLGAFLSSRENMTWGTIAHIGVGIIVELSDVKSDGTYTVASGEGETLAAAILDAISKAGGGG
jgi:hypothetical protein